MNNYLLKILRPVMVAGVMKKVGETIELAEHEAIKLVEGGKAEFTALEKKVETLLGLGESATVSGAAAADIPAVDPAAPVPASPPAAAEDTPAATVSGAAAADAPASNEEPAQ